MEASPLYRLSPELRNHIYEHVFTSKYAVTLQDQKCQHALTRTCKQLRHETLAMYYATTSLNAHLDDGPAKPLTNWLKVIGSGAVCEIDRINVWVERAAELVVDGDMLMERQDLHMLQFTIHGLQATAQIISNGKVDWKWCHQSEHDDIGDLGPRNDVSSEMKEYALRPVDVRFAERNVKDVFLALHTMGLGLARLVILESGEGTERPEKQTSEYAIVPLRSISTNPWAAEDVTSTGIYSEVDTLQKQLELSDEANERMQKQLADGERTITIRERRRVLVLEFDSGGTRMVDFRQAAMSESSHDMLHSVIGAMRNWRAVP